MNKDTIKIHGAVFKAEPVVERTGRGEVGRIYEAAGKPKRQNEYWSFITGLSEETRYSVEVSSTCRSKGPLYGKRIGSTQWFETTLEKAKASLSENLGVSVS